MEIKKVQVWSLVKTFAIIGIVFGIIAGIFLSVYLNGLAGNMTSQLQSAEVQAYLQQNGIDGDQLIEGYQALSKSVLYFVPLVSLVSTAIFALIAALVYNITAKLVGGIKIEFKEAKK